MERKRVDRLACLITEAVVFTAEEARMLAERVIEVLDGQGFEEQFVEYGPSTAVVFLAGAFCGHYSLSVELAMELAQDVIDRDAALVKLEG